VVDQDEKLSFSSRIKRQELGRQLDTLVIVFSRGVIY